ncbi:MAG: hypothetical protein E3J56_11065 [Candidatus Aminicenantes bacterium]|nr:MAG: hypothetical protein E3J56_11065 [Candidatus Aminicenantes bacterium]
MKEQPWNVLPFRGTGSWDGITHKSATAVIDNGVVPYWPHSVRLTTAAAHNLVAGGAITLEGTTNYDGTYMILEVPTTTTLIVESVYIAETLTTTDLFKLTLAPGQAFEFNGFRLHLNAASATTENLTITLDGGAGTDIFDTEIYSKDMNGVQNIIWMPEDGPIPFGKDDELDFAWANSNTKTYGVEALWRRI